MIVAALGAAGQLLVTNRHRSESKRAFNYRSVSKKIIALAQGSGFGEEMEMISTCKFSHEIEGYYERCANGVLHHVGH